MDTQHKTLITEKEQAALLSLSWRGLQEYRKRRLIPFLKIGRSVRYNPIQVAKALEKLTVKSI